MIFRKVIKAAYCGGSRYTSYINKSIRIELDCGHINFRKASQGIPAKAKCLECEWSKNK